MREYMCECAYKHAPNKCKSIKSKTSFNQMIFDRSINRFMYKRQYQRKVANRMTARNRNEDNRNMQASKQASYKADKQGLRLKLKLKLKMLKRTVDSGQTSMRILRIACTVVFILYKDQ